MGVAASVAKVLRPPHVLLVAAAVLAVHPLLWLLATWRDPAYNTQGVWAALAAVALALWSYSSEQQPGSPQNRRYAFALLAFSAAVRLLGQLLRVNVISAVTLAIDVYALATLAGLRQRQRAVSPLWLSVLFAFSLPLERVVQRIAGFGLQSLSADGACGLVGWFSENVQCLGTRIVLDGRDLLVDLPCSGARGLVLVLMLFAGLCAVTRPAWRQALPGLAWALLGALVANTLRIAVLALGLAYAPELDLMSATAHALLGTLAQVLAALPVAVWARRLNRTTSAIRRPSDPGKGQAPDAEHHHLDAPRRAGRGPLPQLQSAAASGRALPVAHRAIDSRRWTTFAWLLLGFAIVAVSAPARPLDVAQSVAAPVAPASVDGYMARPRPLDAVEQAYFARYGGGASKTGYGPYGLLLVSTSAPLRHLHAPDECLRGSGYRVHYEGLAFGDLPTALYRATDADGRSWRVAVSYVSDRGEVAASVAEAVWRWLRAPGATWTMVQRLAPWDIDPVARTRWESGLVHALDLPTDAAHTFFRVPADDA